MGDCSRAGKLPRISIFKVIKPEPKIKLTQTEAFDTFFQYRL